MRFIIQFKPKRPRFIQTMTDTEAEIINQHFIYMKELFDKGKLWLAGRREDGDFGIGIFELSSSEEATKIMKEDPAVKNGVFTATVGLFQVVLFNEDLGDHFVK